LNHIFKKPTEFCKKNSAEGSSQLLILIHALNFNNSKKKTSFSFPTIQLYFSKKLLLTI